MHKAKAIKQYMHMVKAMCMYIRGVRTGNWALHLSDFNRGICQVFFRTRQAQLCQDDSHISSKDVTA